MKNIQKMFGRYITFLVIFIGTLLFCTCNNFFHDLIPPDENLITRFEIDGQVGTTRIGPNTVDVTVEKGTDLNAVIPRISVSRKASLLPMTMDYVQAAFPGIDFLQAAVRLYSTPDITGYVYDLIRENPDFNVPALALPVDFTGPVTFLVISGQGTIRQYTANVEVDDGQPRILGFSFAKYDNPELMGDARGSINETNKNVTTTAVYPVEMDSLTYALIPSFEIMGERMEIGGVEIVSGKTEIQFDKTLGEQTKTVTVWREGVSKDYTLTVNFTEDPDTVRSITDFRFYKTDNSNIAANAVASIVNTGDTGTITVQVFYSSALPQTLIPSFITLGTASVGGIRQTSRINVQDFSSPLNYRVVSRNGLYTRLYTVKVEFINLVGAAPRITSFRFNQNINNELVQDTVGEIGDGLIMIDAYYGGAYPPDTLIPEFTAQGIVTVTGSVQISGASSQFFNRQVKYTVTNPENPALTRDYWVQTRMTRDTSSDAKITAFGFYPGENAGLADPIIGRIDQVTGKITLFESPGSGVTERIMYPRFEAVGQVSVGGIIQSSGTSPQTFNTTIIYTVISANGNNSRDYEVIVRELRSTIFVNCNAWGSNDGTSWQNAFISLKAACEAAALFPEDVPKEIWIAAGTYTPGLAVADYFPLTANTSYIGGFVGNETAKSQRNVTANNVIISGDLGGGLYSSNLFGLFNGDSALTVNGDLAFEYLSLADAKAGGGRGNGAAICAVLPDGAGLTISNLTLQNFTGGGIYHSSGTLTIDKLVLKSISGIGINKINGNGVNISSINADGISGDAVYCTGISSDSVKIENSTFNNTGQVYVASSVPVQVTDTEIRNNSGDSALYVDSGNRATTIERVTIDGVPDGRGIGVNSAGSVWITDSVIKNCTTTGDGGGIYLNGSGNREISNTTIENVQANNGGAVYVNGGSVEIIDTSLQNVRADDLGSGIYLGSSGISSTLTRVTIDTASINSSGAYYGGSVYSDQNLTVIDCAITNVSYGGGIKIGLRGAWDFGSETEERPPATLTIDGLVLRNLANYGIGIYKSVGGDMSLSRIDASDIESEAMRCDVSSRTDPNRKNYNICLKNSVFNNTGRVIFLSSDSAEVSDIKMFHSRCGYASSGLWVFDIDYITIDNVTIDDSDEGIHLTSGVLVRISNSIIRNCGNGHGYYTPGIRLQGSGNIEISGCLIENVEAAFGGAIAIGSASIINDILSPGSVINSLFLTITDTTIRNATATGIVSYQNGTTYTAVARGGAISFNSSGSLVITDSVFESCRTGGSGAGTIYSPVVTPFITNTQFIDCSQ